MEPFEGEADDVGGGAGDALYEEAALALHGISARFVGGLAGGNVPANIFCSQRAEANPCDGDGGPFMVVSVADESYSAHDLMPTTRERAKHSSRFAFVSRLAEDSIVHHDCRVGGHDPGLWLPFRDVERLLDSQPAHVDACRLPLAEPFVHFWDIFAKREAQ